MLETSIPVPNFNTSKKQYFNSTGEPDNFFLTAPKKTF